MSGWAFFAGLFDGFAEFGDDFRCEGDPAGGAGDGLHAFQFTGAAPMVDGANADIEQLGGGIGRVAPIAARPVLFGVGHFRATGGQR